MNENKVAKAIAEAKEKYQAHMNAVHGEDMLCLHPDDLDSVHVEAVLEATKVFDSKRKQNLNCSDEERTAFLEVYYFLLFIQLIFLNSLHLSRKYLLYQERSKS